MDASARHPRRARPPNPNRRPGGDRPTPMCRRESRLGDTTAGDVLDLRLRAAEPGQASGALASDQCPDAFVNQGGALFDAGDQTSFFQQSVVEVEGGSHWITI